jgi:bile acid:Na+ symporter, BASS family
MLTTGVSYMDIMVIVVLATIMFGIGLSISISDLKEVIRVPAPFIYGLFAQMVLLPVMAFSITFFTDLSPALKVGFIILASSPGGTTSGFITVLFRGNVALSVSLTTVNSLLTLFTIPVLVNIALTIYMGSHSVYELPFLASCMHIFIVTLIPATAGVIIRLKWDRFANTIQRPVRVTMIILFAFVYTAIFLTDESRGGSGITMGETFKILPYALAVNVTAFFAGILMGFIGKTGFKSSFTIGIEVAVHNTTLALLVAGTLIHSREMAKPALVYAMFSFWTAILFGVVVKLYNGLKIFGEFRQESRNEN